MYHTMCMYLHMEGLSASHRAQKGFKEFAHTLQWNERAAWLLPKTMTNFFVVPAALSALYSANH